MNKKQKLAELKREEALRKKRLEKQRPAEELRDKRLLQEKIELVKVKSGVETIETDVLPLKEYSTKEKIGNFLYHNKTAVIVGTIVVILVVWVAVAIASVVPMDAKVLIVATNYDASDKRTELENYFAEYVDDTNGDGQIKVSVEYVPLAQDFETKISPNTEAANIALFMAEMGMGESLYVIADNAAVEEYELRQDFADFTTKYPENEFLKPEGLYLDGFDFEEKVGIDFADDVFLAIRKPQKGVSYEEKMAENFAAAEKVFDKFVKISEKK